MAISATQIQVTRPKSSGEQWLFRVLLRKVRERGIIQMFREALPSVKGSKGERMKSFEEAGTQSCGWRSKDHSKDVLGYKGREMGARPWSVLLRGFKEGNHVIRVLGSLNDSGSRVLDRCCGKVPANSTLVSGEEPLLMMLFCTIQ